VSRIFGDMDLTLVSAFIGNLPQNVESMSPYSVSDERAALNTLAREELGIDPEELGAAWTAALISFALFAVGASCPCCPWLCSRGSVRQP